ncbi:MAG: FUSC family protein [Stenotrophobium sp.]
MTTTAREIFRDWAGSEGRTLAFMAKTCGAALLALWIALRLDLESPGSAMLTVFIVSQPLSGMVLAKSAYRALGTIVGCLVTLLLVALFAQYRAPFLIALALWVGLCSAGAARYCDFKAYAFLLAGYTACLIGFPAIARPEAAFDIAVARGSAVLLGIVCGATVSDVILPQRLTPALVALVRGRFRDFTGFVREALRGEIGGERLRGTHARFVTSIIQFESLRSAAFFEDAESRVRNNRLKRLNLEFMAALTSFHSLHAYMNRLRRLRRDEVVDVIMGLYRPLADALLLNGKPAATAAEAVIVERQIGAAAAQLHGAQPSAGAAFDGAADRLDYDCAAELLLRLAQELHTYARTYASLHSPRAPDGAAESARFTPHSDLVSTLLMGGRAMLALIVLEAFWIASAWPGGPSAATFACVVCCLFAAAPSPQQAVAQMGSGILLGSVMGFVCAMFVLPHADGFAMLALALLPFLALGAWLTTRPQLGGAGSGYLILMAILTVPSNHLQHDPALLLNEIFAQLAGLAVAGLAFTVLIPTGNAAQKQRMLATLRREVARACREPLDGLRPRFESRTRDLLAQLAARADPTAGEDRAMQDTALAVLEIGHAMLDLRSALHAQPQPRLRGEIDALLARIAAAFAQPTPASQSAAIAAVERLLAQLPDQAPQRLRLCLHRIRGVLFDNEIFAAPTLAATVMEQRPHAA